MTSSAVTSLPQSLYYYIIWFNKRTLNERSNNEVNIEQKATTFLWLVAGNKFADALK